MFGHLGHELSHAWKSIDNPNTLGLIGMGLGYASGLGPLAMAFGGSMGGALGGGSLRHDLGLGLLGGLGGYGLEMMADPIASGGMPSVAEMGALDPVAGDAAAGGGGLFGMGSSGWGMRNYLGLLGAGTGLKSFFEGEQLRKGAGSADPYAQTRQQYLAQMQALESNPASIVNTPGYAAGEQALERTLAAEGYTGSGKAATDIAAYGSQVYNQQMTTLGNLAQMGDPTAPARVAAMGMGSEASGLEQMGLGMAMAFL